MSGGRWLARIGRQPGDASSLLELHHVILTDTALGQDHREDVTDGSDALVRPSLGQVVVPVPPGLLGRVGDEFEDHVRGRGHAHDGSPANRRDPREHR